MADTHEQLDIRAEFIDSTVKGFALQEMKMKPLLMESSSSAWKESYYQETSTDLTAGATRNIRGVPRLSAFPVASTSWTKKSAIMEKYAVEDVISIEDVKTNEIDVMARTLLRISRAIARAVDTQIWNVLTENQSVSLINTVAIASGYEWNSATLSQRLPISDILDAMTKIAEDNYDIYTGGYLVVNPQDYANIMKNSSISNSSQFYTSTPTSEGRLNSICGLNFIVSPVVTADYALVVKSKECGTLKVVTPLTTATIYNEGIGYTIRAWAHMVAYLVNPECCCLITNTRA